MKRREYPLEINQRWWRRLRCLATEHSFQAGELWDPDQCDHCWYHDNEINEDEITLNKLLNRAYGWMCRRNWGWFNRLDFWLVFVRKVKPPSWWNY